MLWQTRAPESDPSGRAMVNWGRTPEFRRNLADLALRIAQDDYRLCVDTIAIKRDLVCFRRHADGFHVTLTESTEDYVFLGLIGPEVARIAAEIGAPELNELGHFNVGLVQIVGKHVRAGRMSYVGEAGWEITCRSENPPVIYAALIGEDAVPAGPYAQTAKRIENGFCPIGRELDSNVSAIEARLEFATHKTGGRIFGQTTFTADGFWVDAPVAPGLAEGLEGRERVQIDIARKMLDAKVAIGPLVVPSIERMRP